MFVFETEDAVLTDKYSHEELDYFFWKMVEFLKTKNTKVDLYALNLENAPLDIQKIFHMPDDDVHYVNY